MRAIVWGLIAGYFVFSGTGYGQVATGTIVGTVRDGSGAIDPTAAAGVVGRILSTVVDNREMQTSGWSLRSLTDARGPIPMPDKSTGPRLSKSGTGPEK